MIPPPMNDEHYEDRASDCEMALQMKVDELVDRSALVGWTRSKPWLRSLTSPSPDVRRKQKTSGQTSGAKALVKVEH